MLAIRMGNRLVAWCHLPRQIPVMIAQLYGGKPAQIIPTELLNEAEMKEFKALEKLNIDGRYLEK